MFVLFNDQSQTYADIISLGIALYKGIKGRLRSEDATFLSFLHYFECLTNNVGSAIVEEIEAATQLSGISPRRHRSFDITRAKELFEKTGRDGEIAIDNYFSNLKKQKIIADYTWVNKDRECGLPYDFSYTTPSGNTVYLDVKTTNYRFQQKMFFSSQEIEFATSPAHANDNYHVYRVYKNNTGELCLRISSNIQGLFMYIRSYTPNYESAINIVAKVETIKYSILPEQEDLNFGEEIKLV